MSSFKQPPPYKNPITIQTPEINQIARQKTFIQSGINYRIFKHLNCLGQYLD